MTTLKAMKKKVARKLRSAKKSVRKLSVRLNKLKRKKTHGKKRRRRRSTRRRRGGQLTGLAKSVSAFKNGKGHGGQRGGIDCYDVGTHGSIEREQCLQRQRESRRKNAKTAFGGRRR